MFAWMLQQLEYTFYLFKNSTTVGPVPDKSMDPLWKRSGKGSVCACGLDDVSLAIDPAVAYTWRARRFYSQALKIRL